LRQEAIALLLRERGEIDSRLETLGYGQATLDFVPPKKKGRPPKEKATEESVADATLAG
jgi:hypothetical protein